jgi:hypothetical protein
MRHDGVADATCGTSATCTQSVRCEAELNGGDFDRLQAAVTADTRRLVGIGHDEPPQATEMKR